MNESSTTTHHAGGVLNRRWVQDVLPLASSLALHAGLIVVGIALYRAVVRSAAPPDREQTVVPVMERVRPSRTPGGLPHPGLRGDPSPPAGPWVTPTADDRLFDAASDAGRQPSFIGSTPARLYTAGNGPADGRKAPWQPPGGTDGPGAVGLYGTGLPTGAHANDVVYLCDASGSMLGVFGQLKQELKRSVGQLSVGDDAAQRFNVIFFSDGPPTALFPDGLRFATPANRQAAFDFIDRQVSTGGTAPLPAIRLALAERPDLLFVLTDGFDQAADLDAVVNEFRRGDADRHTQVNCVFLQSDEDPKLVAVLRRIAAAGHGEFKAILKREM